MTQPKGRPVACAARTSPIPSYCIGLFSSNASETKGQVSRRDLSRMQSTADALEAEFPLAEKLEPTVEIKLNAPACYDIVRHFDYGICVRVVEGRLKAEISEPFTTDDAYSSGRDALRLLNRAILWIYRNELEFALHAVRAGVLVRM